MPLDGAIVHRDRLAVKMPVVTLKYSHLSRLLRGGPSYADTTLPCTDALQVKQDKFSTAQCERFWTNDFDL